MAESLGIICGLRRIQRKDKLSEIRHILWSRVVFAENPLDSICIFNPIGLGAQIVYMLADMGFKCNVFVPTGFLSVVSVDDMKEWELIKKAGAEKDSAPKVLVFENKDFTTNYNELQIKDWNASIINTMKVFKSKCNKFLIIDNGSKAYLSQIKNQLDSGTYTIIRPPK